MALQRHIVIQSEAQTTQCLFQMIENLKQKCIFKLVFNSRLISASFIVNIFTVYITCFWNIEWMLNPHLYHDMMLKQLDMQRFIHAAKKNQINNKISHRRVYWRQMTHWWNHPMCVFYAVQKHDVILGIDLPRSKTSRVFAIFTESVAKWNGHLEATDRQEFQNKSESVTQNDVYILCWFDWNIVQTTLESIQVARVIL